MRWRPSPTEHRMLPSFDGCFLPLVDVFYCIVLVPTPLGRRRSLVVVNMIVCLFVECGSPNGGSEGWFAIINFPTELFCSAGRV